MAHGRPKTQGTPNWVECATTDLDRSEAFYAELFGWTSQRFPVEGGPDYAVQMLNGAPVAGMFALSEELLAKGVPAHWGTYLEVDDVDASAKRVVAAGGLILDPAKSAPGVGTFCVIRDPTGGIVHLWHSTEENGVGLADTPGALTWSELATHDPEAAAEFYATVLDLDAETIPGDPPYTVLRSSDGPVAGILKISPEMGEVPPAWDVYFASEDVDATTAAAEKAGATVLRAPFDVGGGMARMAVLQDPVGAVFEVIKMQES